ncbi:MAG: YqgE/AlgH family protein [Planctomycetaceae bacterium]
MTETLRGKFLIACTKLQEPNFHKTVVLLVEHSDDGAMGLVVNRPSSISAESSLSNHFGIPFGDDCIFFGGPVEPTALFIMHNRADAAADDEPIVPGVFVGHSAEVFESVVGSAAAGNSELAFRIYFGCAGWSPGQLEGEIARGDWWVAPACSNLAFHDDPYNIWDVAVGRVFESNRLLPQTTAHPEWN